MLALHFWSWNTSVGLTTVTASETAECVLALDACGRVDQARTQLTCVQYLREPDGSYGTGCVHPEEIHFPDGERTSYTAAVMLLASDALGGLTPASGLFRGESPVPWDAWAPALAAWGSLVLAVAFAGLALNARVEIECIAVRQ